MVTCGQQRSSGDMGGGLARGDQPGRRTMLQGCDLPFHRSQRWVVQP